LRLFTPAQQRTVVHAQVGHGLDAGLHGAQGHAGLMGERRRGVAQQLGAVGQWCGIPSLRGQRHHPGSGIEIEEGSQDGRSADAIENGVMHLGDQRRAFARQTFDQIHLPQGPVRVEPTAHDRGDESVEFPRPTGRGQARSREVIVQIEVWVVHPDRVVQSEGDAHGPLPKGTDHVQALTDDATDLGVAGRRREERTGSLGGVEHHDRPDMHGRGRCLER
jgi:hypothetical protein